MLAPEEVYPFHMSLIRHGRRICRAQRPLCVQCPLAPRCPSAVLPDPAHPERVEG